MTNAPPVEGLEDLDADIRARIEARLCELERERGIVIPFAVESGSRAWGFASPDSDYDCRFIYVRPREAYLSVFEPRDTIEDPVDAVFDVAGWDVKKVIRHLTKSNAVLLEWLRSGVIYRRDAAVADELWVLARAFFNPVAAAWHYLSMARKKLDAIRAEETSRLKQYVYVLRPLACVRYIRERGDIPFTEYRRNLEAVAVPEEIRREIGRLLALKATAAEADRVPRQEALLAYCAREVREAEAWLDRTHADKHTDYAAADACFRRIVEMTARERLGHP